MSTFIHLRSISFVFLTLAAFLGIDSEALAQDPGKPWCRPLRTESPYGPGSAEQRWLETFLSELEENIYMPEGAVIKTSTAMNTREIVGKLQRNEIDVAVIPVSYLTKFSQAISALTIPGVVFDGTESDRLRMRGEVLRTARQEAADDRIRLLDLAWEFQPVLVLREDDDSSQGFVGTPFVVKKGEHDQLINTLGGYPIEQSAIARDSTIPPGATGFIGDAFRDMGAEQMKNTEHILYGGTIGRAHALVMSPQAWEMGYSVKEKILDAARSATIRYENLGSERIHNLIMHLDQTGIPIHSFDMGVRSKLRHNIKISAQKKGVPGNYLQMLLSDMEE